MGLLDKLFGPPSRDVFARELMTALRTAGDREDIVYEREEFRLVRPKSKDVTNLETIYAEHCSLPRSQRKAHLQGLAEAFVMARQELPDSFDEARDHLRPKIWTRAQFANMELQQRIDGDDPLDLPLYPLGEHLLTTVVYDLPSSMRSLSDEDFERWNTSYYEALEAARINLDEATLAWARIGDHFHSSLTGDNYDSSRILLADRIRELDLIGAPIAMVPTRDSLLIAGSEDIVSLTMMLDLADESLQKDPRPLSGIPLRLVDDDWEDWTPPTEHPLFERFHSLAQQFLGGLYGVQKELLNSLHKQQDADIFVASFSGIEDPDSGRQRSYCVWGEGVDAMLPETDLILLPTEADAEGQGGPRIGGEWDDVQSVAGDLMQPVPGLYPPRWRVREFPSRQQLEEIGTFTL